MPESKSGKQKRKVLWEPQAKQAIALEYDDVYELFYGGAKGGGKSDFLLIDYLRHVNSHGKHYHGIVFRRSFPELEELVSRSQQLYPQAFPGANYLEGKKTWTFPSGATLKMRFLETDQDVYHYTGHQYQYIAFDELTNWPAAFPYIFMHSCARSAHGVPIRIRASGNPGNVGHLWVKQRFIDVAPPLTPYKDDNTGLYRIFIPARLDDNTKLLERDPQYENRLKALPEALYNAYRWGRWDVFIGQAISEWDPRHHIIEPHDLPASARYYMTFDWGYGRPFSVGWWIQDNEGRIVRVREWYGWNGTPNEGIRLTDPDIATGILEREQRWGIQSSQVIRFAGQDCFSRKPNYMGGGQGPSTADVFRSYGIQIRPADDNRHKKLAAFHNRLRIGDNGAGLVVFSTCEQFIRTIPALVTDKNDPEDIDTDCEDHVYDEACHICMAKSGEVGQRATMLNPDLMCA